MHPEDIKAAIRKAGSSPAAIARELKVSNTAVSHAIRGNKSTRIAKVIVRVTKQRFAVLWPGKYPEFEFVEAAGLSSLPSERPAPSPSKLQRPAATPASGKSAKARQERPK